ncbi:MAG TPA: DUF4352 domain-containing protein [Chroococcales cyanobacterium]
MNRLFRKLTSWTVTIALLALAVGCSSTKQARDTSSSPDTASQSSIPTSSPNIELQPSAKSSSQPIHRIGEMVAIKDSNLNLQLTVNGTRNHQGKGVIKPNKGHKWIVVDTTIANQGQQPQIIAVSGFKLIDSQNKLYDVALLASALDDIKSPTGEIKPGDKQGGEVVFEVPESAKGLRLVFQPQLACDAPASARALETTNCKPIVIDLG